MHSAKNQSMHLRSHCCHSCLTFLKRRRSNHQTTSPQILSQTQICLTYQIQNRCRHSCLTSLNLNHSMHSAKNQSMHLRSHCCHSCLTFLKRRRSNHQTTSPQILSQTQICLTYQIQTQICLTFQRKNHSSWNCCYSS
mmetsp:Transcript_14936/g.23124  ORF Transcript_14936/g.23124 Transcript_14936/m.23124 type:complete len:138 (-) Transcript_14936:209-622(-)